MSEWEIVRGKEDMIRRLEVPGGWLYQVQRGREYLGHPSNNRWEPTWHPPYFVPVAIIPLPNVLGVTKLGYAGQLADPQPTREPTLNEKLDKLASAYPAHSARWLVVGDRFRWKEPPKGWSNSKMIITNGPPGWALPEGWDFFDVSVLDAPIEILAEHPPMNDA